MTELWIDDVRVTLPPGEVRQTLQNNRLGSVSDRQLNFTNQFKLPFTAENAAFFQHIQDINSLSPKPYRYLPAVLVADGFEVAVGTAKVVKNSPRDVTVSIRSGGEGLFNAINGLTLRDLDWSALDHTLDYTILVNSQDGSQPYIYAHREMTNLVNRQDYIDYWLPSVYEHVILDMIFTQAGYTYSGDIFTDPEYLAKVVNPVTFDENQPDPFVRDFATFMPEVSQVDFIREIMVRYGLVFKVTRNTNNYEFLTTQSVFSDIEGAVDWSAKFSSVKETAHTLGAYARRNYFRYTERDAYNGSADGFFDLDIDHVPQTTDVYTSIYAAYYQLTVFDTLLLPIYEIDGNGTKILEVEPSVSEVEQVNAAGQYRTEAAVDGPVYSGDTPFLRFNNLNWSKFTLERYNALKQIANRAKVVTANMLLSPVDIYNLDFTRLVWVQALSSYFYVDRVNNWVAGRLCEVTLVRIPPNVFSQAEIGNTAPVVTLTAENSPVAEDTPATFLITVTDAENNVERWEFDPGVGLPVTGFGLPPATLDYTYNTPGTYTATLTVFDFEGLSGSDTAQIAIEDTFVVSLDAATGEYAAPPGSTVTVNCSIGGQDNQQQALISVGTVQGGNPGDAGYSDLGSRQIYRTASQGSSTAQFVFTMPASGLAYLKLIYYVGLGGPTVFGFATAQLTNNGETHAASVSNQNQNYPA